jgi:two-component system KDP operon response regulator KdpE
MTLQPKVLLIDGDQTLVRVLKPVVEAAGFDVQAEACAVDGMVAAKQFLPDLLLIDLALPDMSGTDAIAAFKQLSTVPIIILSAANSERERVEALDAGASDFVAKPFSVDELLARMRVALRKPTDTGGCYRLSNGSVEFDFEERNLKLNGTVFRLTKREAELLRVLFDSKGRTVRHQQILQKIWGDEAFADTQHVRVLVTQLRQKIGHVPSARKLITTVPGLGYRLD